MTAALPIGAAVLAIGASAALLVPGRPHADREPASRFAQAAAPA